MRPRDFLLAMSGRATCVAGVFEQGQGSGLKIKLGWVSKPGGNADAVSRVLLTEQGLDAKHLRDGGNAA